MALTITSQFVLNSTKNPPVPCRVDPNQDLAVELAITSTYSSAINTTLTVYVRTQGYNDCVKKFANTCCIGNVATSYRYTTPFRLPFGSYTISVYNADGSTCGLPTSCDITEVNCV